MGIEVKITPEDIDALVRDAVMKAGFGKLITDTIRSVTNSSSYNSPVENAVRAFVQEQAMVVLKEHYVAFVQEAIGKALKEKMTKEWIEWAGDQLVETMIREASRR